MECAVIELVETARRVLMYVCVCALFAIIASCAIYAFRIQIRQFLDRVRGLHPFQQFMVSMFLTVCVLYGGTKGTINYDGGIRANSSNPSLVTNDIVRITWERIPGAVLPLSSPVYIDYREHGSTNEWGLLGQAIVSDYMWEGTLANATNYDYNVWAYYIPPEPVHTNGVWSFSTMRDRKNDGILPMRAVIKADVEILSPPNLKGKIR